MEAGAPSRRVSSPQCQTLRVQLCYVQPVHKVGPANHKWTRLSQQRPALCHLCNG